MVNAQRFEHVAVALIYANPSTILIAKRHKHLYQGGKWEFPGGKVEKAETVFSALKRECQEEVGIQVISAEPFCEVRFSYDDKTVLLDTWKVTKYTGEAVGLEQQELRWVDVGDFDEYKFPKPNQIIIEKIIKKRG